MSFTSWRATAAGGLPGKRERVKSSRFTCVARSISSGMRRLLLGPREESVERRARVDRPARLARQSGEARVERVVGSERGHEIVLVREQTLDRPLLVCTRFDFLQ